MIDCTLHSSLLSKENRNTCYLIQIQMKKYSDSLGNLHRLQSAQVRKKHTQFNTYEDYLHQNISHGTYKRSRRPPPSRLLAKHINHQHTKPPSHPTSSTIQYYPIQRIVVDYQDRKIKQLTPKKKIITEYVNKKHVQMVAKEVVVKDYYAVEYVRGYIKKIVPEVKIEYASVEKVIKRQEVIPHEKQIVYYPPHLTDLEEIKREAQHHLSKNGVIITLDAQYRPAITPPSTQVLKSSHIHGQRQRQLHAISSVTKGSPLSPSLTKSNYYRLPRPNRPHLAYSRSLDKNIKYSLPIYKEDLESESVTQEGRSRLTTHYSFAEREGSLKMSSSFNRNA